MYMTPAKKKTAKATPKKASPKKSAKKAAATAPIAGVKGHPLGCFCSACQGIRTKAEKAAKAKAKAEAKKKADAKKKAAPKKAAAKKTTKKSKLPAKVKIGYKREQGAEGSFTEVDGSKNALRVLQAAAEDRGIETMHCWREVKPNGVKMVENLDLCDLEDKTIAEVSATGPVFVGPYSKFG